MEALIGVVLWAVIGWVIVRAVKKIVKARGEARATAIATAAGGTAGARADVGGVHIHLHIGGQTTEVAAPSQAAEALGIVRQALAAQANLAIDQAPDDIEVDPSIWRPTTSVTR